MKPVIALILLWAWAGQAQVVAVWPTNYTHAMTSQNNLGKFWSRWQTENQTFHELDGRKLTVRRIVVNHEKWVVPKLIETIEEYWQIGLVTYRQTDRVKIIWWAPRADGRGWVAQTNTFEPNLAVYEWTPSVVGELVTGNTYWRTIEAGSPLECFGWNRVGTIPYLVTLKCATGQTGFAYQVRFERGEAKTFTVDLTRANFLLPTSVDYFKVDLAFGIDDEPLVH